MRTIRITVETETLTVVRRAKAERQATTHLNEVNATAFEQAEPTDAKQTPAPNRPGGDTSR